MLEFLCLSPLEFIFKWFSSILLFFTPVSFIIFPSPSYLSYGIMEQGHFPFSTLKTLYFWDSFPCSAIPSKKNKMTNLGAAQSPAESQELNP